MKTRSFLRFAVLSLAIGSAAFAADSAPPEAVPPELPVATFFASPEITSLKFSPNGRYLAALVPVERRMNLLVMDLESGAKTLATKLTDESIQEFYWANDDRLLFRRDEGGNERGGLYAVNRKGGVIDRLAYAGKDTRTADINYTFGGLIRPKKGAQNKFLVYAYETHNDRPDIAEMDVRSGVMRVLTPNPGYIVEWHLDWNDVPRVGVSYKDGTSSILYRDRDREAWSTLTTFSTGEAHWEPLGFDGDNRTLYVVSNVGRKTYALYKYDTKDRKMGELVFADDTYDLNPEQSRPIQLLREVKTHRVVGISYEADKLRQVYWDDAFARQQAQIDRSLPGTINTITVSGEDDDAPSVEKSIKRLLINSRSDREPGVYYLFDETKKRLEQLAVVRPSIDPGQMAEMKHVEYVARDGVNIHAYLTLPKGRAPKNLPLIVNPHGGPYGIRDTWRYVGEIQMLANRGFAVLQMNYRGSGGYGDAFEELGYQKWGLEMQNDISDGVAWAVTAGIADPSRVVIYGASYGGYAAMAGITFTPELYCAGINYVGVVDLPMLYSMLEGAAARERIEWTRKFGDVESSAVQKRWRDTSPANFAERIRVPLLMGYGKNDPRVKIGQLYSIESALKRAGKQYELAVEEDEGHGFRKEENSIAWYERIDAFLKKNVPTRTSRVELGTPEVLQMPAKP